MTARKHDPERSADNVERLATHAAGLATDAERLVEAKESKKGDGLWRPGAAR